GLAGAVLTEHRHDLTARDPQRHVVVGEQVAVAHGDAGELEEHPGAGRRCGRAHFFDTSMELAGALSSTGVVKVPSMISALRSSTSWTSSSGTPPTTSVLIGASSLPPTFMKEYSP